MVGWGGVAWNDAENAPADAEGCYGILLALRRQCHLEEQPSGLPGVHPWPNVEAGSVDDFTFIWQHYC